MQQLYLRNAEQVADTAMPVQFIHCCRRTDTACRREAAHEAGKVVQYRIRLASCGPLSLIGPVLSCRNNQPSSLGIRRGIESKPERRKSLVLGA